MARISKINSLQENFSKKNFNLDKIIGEAWCIRNNPEKDPFNVKILFLNDAAQSIREYKFHKSQKLESVKEGILASWCLSCLDEFACWLLQWLENIKIIEPPELKKIISQKIARYLENEKNL